MRELKEEIKCIHNPKVHNMKLPCNIYYKTGSMYSRVMMFTPKIRGYREGS